MKSGVIIIEGNIGAGKSTLAQILANKLNGEYIPEPNEADNPYLSDYYVDPARWAFNIQMFLLTKRYRAHKYAQTRAQHSGGFVVMDRSYYGDVCFANVQRQLGYFSQRDYSTYLCHHTDMKFEGLKPPAVALFLDVSPDKCLERINARFRRNSGRECESGISLGYLNALDDEISALSASMAPCTYVKHIPWGIDRSENEIKKQCDALVLEIRAKKQTAYDFWTGANGIGE